MKVVDSWALVAWVRREPAAPLVRQIIEDASAGHHELVMSWINASETYYILAKRNSREIADQFFARLPTLPIRLIVPGQEGIMAAARIKASYAVAFGDAFALALAQARNASVVTGDPEIRRCGLVPVDWVGDDSRTA